MPLKTSLFFSKLGGNAIRKYVPATGRGEDGFAQTGRNAA
jgi:hypothetical protein